MGNGDTDYVDVFIVAILWGCTNPFLRKGAYEEDEKVRIQHEEQFLKGQKENLQEEEQLWKEHTHDEDIDGEDAEADEDEEGSMQKIQPVHNNSDQVSESNDNCREMGYSTFSPVLKTSSEKKVIINLSPNSNYNLFQENTIDELNKNATSSSCKSSSDTVNIDFQQYLHHQQQQQQQQQHTRIPTSYIKGISLQFLSKYCCCSSDDPNILLSKIANFHPKYLMKQFLASIVFELSKFTKPKIAIPFLFNQCSAIFYYKLIATSALTNVAYCQAMSMAIEGIVSYLLGERMSHPVRGFGGALIVTLGVGICLMSDEIQRYLFGDDNGDGVYYSQEEGNNDRQLLFDDYNDDGDGNLWQSGSNTSLFEISPFVCWYALCGIIHWFRENF